MSDGFKQSASTPRVTRSRFVKEEFLLMDGEQFEDGRLRVVVPESTSDKDIAGILLQLDEDDRENDRMDALIRKVQDVTRIVGQITGSKK